MWDAVLQVLLTDHRETVTDVHLGEILLCFDPALMVTDLAERLGYEEPGMTAAAVRTVGAHPADLVDDGSVASGVAQDAQLGGNGAVVGGDDRTLNGLWVVGGQACSRTNTSDRSCSNRYRVGASISSIDARCSWPMLMMS